ncbi:filamentous hemagglutinin N-terminal domain-containing protein [Erwinia piriflorinigrans]|nr:filamentous hemagglutinin N-terminal domain-containing protein [Erwinia piriflorinigrans]
MTKHRYRFIFSRAGKARRGVAKRSPGRINQRGQYGNIREPRSLMTVRSLVRLLALFTGPAAADGIVTDGAATPGQRPQVITTHNGVPQVNITAPNQAGVSHNQYQQFDVGQKGIVLNNSAVTTSTRLVGMVQGNPNLNSTPAKVILNEVNSPDPSQLRGFIEVAGKRAQVIVANPAGIVCSGCGTINAGRMTLTTGKPQLKADGGLAGHAVERGVIRIEGDGLNGDARHDTEYVDVLARAVEVNAGIWAQKELTVVAGRNHVSADGQRIIAQAADGKSPELAIDMGQMGGMYSGHIRMVGTEAGVGVRNQGGRLQAGKTLSVGSEGKLVWQSADLEGVTQAGGEISFAARDDVEHHGKLHSGSRLSVVSRTGALKQSGTLSAAGDVQLKGNRGIHSRGHLLSGSDANDQLIDTADLTLTSMEDIRVNGSLLSRKDVNLSGRRIDISQSQLVADRAMISAQSGGVVLRQAKVNSRKLGIKTTGNVEAQQAQITANQWDIHANRLFNQNAIWSQQGSGKSRFALHGALDNRDAELGSNGDLTLDVGSLANQYGSVYSRLALNLTVGGDIHNARGELLSGALLNINVGGAVNNGSGIINGGQLQIATQHVNNVQGQLIGQGDLNLSTRQGLDNRAGEISAQRLDLTTHYFANTQGSVIALQGLNLYAVKALDNAQGLLAAGEAMNIRTRGEVNNRGGTIQGGSATTLVARAIDNDQGRLLSGKRLMLRASEAADNHSGAISGERLELTAQRLGNLLGKIIALRELNLTIKLALDNTKGLLEAGEALVVRTDGDWENRGGAAQGGSQVNAAARRFNNDGGRLQSGGEMILNSIGDVSNQGGKITAQQGLSWQGGTTSRLDNDGGSLQSAGDLSLQGKELTNRQRGMVSSQQALSLRLAGDWNNQGGTLTGNGRTVVHAADLHNAQGVVNTLDSLEMDFTAGLDNGSGRIFSKRSQRLHAPHIFNMQGRIGSQGGWDAVSDDINNREGRIQSLEDAAITATVLDNANGVVQSAGGLDLHIVSDTDNRSGKLSATGPLNLKGSAREPFSGNLDNRDGQLLSGGRLTVAAQRADNQLGGLFYSQKAMRLDLKQALDNRHGRVQSGEGLQLNAQSLLNTAGAVDSRQQLRLGIMGLLDNDRGAIRSNGNQHIAAEQVANRWGVFSSYDGLSLAAAQLDNADGRLNSKGVGVYRAGSLDNQRDKLHSGDTLTLNATRLNNRAGQLVSTRMFALNVAQFDNSGQAGFDIQANGDLHIHSDTLRAGSALALLNQGGLVQSGETLSLNARTLDNQGGTLHSQHCLNLSVAGVLTHRDGVLLYRGGDQHLGSNDLLENRTSFMAAKGDIPLEVHRLDSLPEEQESAHDVEGNDDKWQRYNNYLRPWGSVVNTGRGTLEATTRQLTFRDDAAAQNDRYGTLLAIDASSKRVQVRVKDTGGQLRDLWINYLALKPGVNGGYAITFYEMRGGKRKVPTPWHHHFRGERDMGRSD